MSKISPIPISYDFIMNSQFSIEQIQYLLKISNINIDEDEPDKEPELE